HTFSHEISQFYREANIITQVVTRQSLRAAVPWADLVVSAGGDGTYLTAAAAVADKTPVIGINTDPVGSEFVLFRSEGHLCIGGKNPPHDLFQRIVEGKFQRPSAAAAPRHGMITNLEICRKFSSCDRLNYLSFRYYGMNRVEEQSVSAILEAMQSMGIEVKANVRGLAEEIAKKMNDKIAFEPDHPNFAYSIREPIFNATFKRTSVRGFARRIRLKSKCSKGFLVLDGATKIPFNSGTEVLLEIFEADALRTIKL
ncbi:hypothetical protein ANCCEY_02777, partial [Ancylostoma ceylanicum]